MVTMFDILGFTPNLVTLLGLFIVTISAICISLGYMFLAGIILIIGGALDLVDGGLARKQNSASSFGALLDSVIDRIQEGLILLTLMIYYQINSCDWTVLSYSICGLGATLAFTAFISSIMVSYVRAKAESLGIDCKSGVMTRPERVVAISIGLLLFNWLPQILISVLAIITILGSYTTLQRVIESHNRLKK
jgi:CDP-diacylglycerol--glycerol-3-phosphate 3-phosphatidyltransferase